MTEIKSLDEDTEIESDTSLPEEKDFQEIHQEILEESQEPEQIEEATSPPKSVETEPEKPKGSINPIGIFSMLEGFYASFLKSKFDYDWQETDSENINTNAEAVLEMYGVKEGIISDPRIGLAFAVAIPFLKAWGSSIILKRIQPTKPQNPYINQNNVPSNSPVDVMKVVKDLQTRIDKEKPVYEEKEIKQTVEFKQPEE
ncbi:MAG: hypothetical protein ACP5U0_07460 [Caldisphaera sp.]